MAIKIKGDTIIDDSRVIVNADKIGIGQYGNNSPKYDLEILPNTNNPAGIAVSAVNIQSDDTNKAISVFNSPSGIGASFTVSHRGRVDAVEYYGTFKGIIDPSTSDNKIEQGDTKAEVIDTNGDGYFLVETEGSERLRINHSGISTFTGNLSVQDGDFEITRSGSPLNTQYETTTDNGIYLYYDAARSGTDKVLAQHSYKRNGTVVAVQEVNTSQTEETNFRFKTHDGTSLSERLRITSGGSVGIGTKNLDDPVTSSNTAKLAVGIVTANEYYGTFKGTIDSTVNSISLDTNLENVFSVSGNQLSADSAGEDKIVFWDNDGDTVGVLTYLSVDINTLEIDDTTLKVKASAVGKNYTLPFTGTNGGSGVGIVTWTLTDDVTPTAGTDPVTLLAGSNISISNVDETNGKFTIAAVQGAGVGIAASASAVLNVNGGEIGGVNPGLTTDKLVYWDEDGTYTGGSGKLDYLTVGTGLEIVSGELKIDTNVVGKTYTLPVTVEGGTSGSGGNSGIATLTLTDDANPVVKDPVTIEAGDGIVIESATDGFKISADISGGGGGGVSDVQVIQYSNNADPRNVRTSTNPIDVQKSVGIVTIGIGTTSNAYGNRFVGPNTPSGAVEGDIWYDTTTSGQGISRVAVVKDQKSAGVAGGTFVKNGWRDRDLTVEDDPFDLVIFYPTVRSDGADPQTQPSETGASSPPSGAKPGYFSLESGTYKIRFSAPAFKTNQHVARMVWSSNQSTINKIVDVSTDSFDGQYYGTSEFCNDNNGRVTNDSEGVFVVEITQTTYFKVIHYGKNGQSSNGFGVAFATGTDPETYTVIEIEDLAAAIKDDGNTNRIIQGNTKAEVNDTNGDGHFLVETEGSERLRIDSTGKATFSGDVQIDGDELFIADSIKHVDDTDTSISFPSNDTIRFNTAGDERLRITSAGDVGIGTTNPDAPVLSSNNAKLAVGIVTAHEAYINALNLNTSGAGVGDLLTSGGPDGIFGIYNTTNSGKTVFPIKDSAGNYNNILELVNDKAIIDGNVGIGSTIPKTKLDVHGTDAIVVPVGTTAERPSNASAGMFRYNSTEEQFEGYTNSWGAIAGSGGGGSVATSIQTFTTDGSFTYTPTPGTTSIVVHVIGAGGGSGTPKNYAWSGGGGAGGVAVKTYSVTEFGTSAAIQVGAKGTAGTANNTNTPQNGGTGGSSSFNPNGTGVTITAYGGVGSGHVVGQGNYTEGGDGGAAANGDLNYTGEKGYVFVDRAVNPGFTNYNGIVPDWRYHSGSTEARYHLYRAKPSAGGYGSYGLGGEATTTAETTVYNNGREGNDGAVIIYEYAGSGSGGSGIGSSFVLLPEQTVTAGDTYVEFTDIPSDALEITLLFKGLSANGNNHYVVQLGTSSGYITTGYVGNSENSMGTSHVASNTTDRAGFVIFGDGGGAELHGSMIINKASSNSYTEIGEFRKSNTGGAVSRGSLSSVSGTVDRLKIFLNGTNTFDAGTMSLSYKTSGSGSAAAITKVAVLQDVRGQSRNGGTATAGNWHGRRLNTKLDPTNFVAFTSTAVDSNGDGENNTFILGAGTYLLQWRAPGFDAGKMIAKMAYTTDPNYNTLFNSQSSAGVNYLSGETAQTSSGISATSSTASGDLYATGSATVTINQTTYFRLQHYISAVATVAEQTLGRNNDINGENEIYSQVIVQDLETASLSGGAHVNVGTTPPTSPSPNPGDLWWNSDTGDLHVYYTTQWVAVNSDERIQKVSATGGTTNIVNGYKVHKFTTSGTFDVTASGEVEVLVVAGGGSEGGLTYSTGQPGCHGGGGGGGGGVVRKLIDVHAGSKYKVTVGAGGGWRSNGGDSSFAGEAQALGGGAGGATLTANGNGGGSGGGASRATLTNQGGASEQLNTYGYGMGNNGGNIGNPDSTPGGGGGAGGAGSSGSPQGNGDGGPGYDASDFEVGLYVGAGGNANGSTNSSAEGRTPNNTNGAANTGAGGGGSPGGTNPRYSGGSGVVFVRYVI